MSLSRETLDYLERVWREPPSSLPRPQTGLVLAELADLHQKLVQEQLDKELASHQVLLELVRLERKR
jgi:hypothetical protein